MENTNDNIPFSYERGKCKLNGSTEKDRSALKLEIILHWTWKIILAISVLITIVYRFFNQ
jgi:hypothetical protein